MKLQKLFIVSLFLFFTSCGGKSKTSFEKNFISIVGEESSSLRGHQLNDAYQNVISKENSEYLQYQDSSMLRYTIHYTDSEEYKIAYLFERDLLTEIRFEAFLGQVSDGDKMIELFKKRFDKKYGFGQEEQGIMTWNKNGESVELLNESELFGYGKIQLIIFPTPKEPKPRPLPL